MENGETDRNEPIRRKRILYVDRAYREGSQGQLNVFAVANALRGLYDVDQHYNLDDYIIPIVESAMISNPYAAIVTHVPSREEGYIMSVPGMEITLYGHSLDILERLKTITDIPIIAYTGANKAAYFYEDGADEVICKSGDSQADIMQIKESLAKLLNEYQKGLLSVPPPVIERKEGYTCTDVTVQLRGGITGLAAVGVFCKRCCQYPDEILVTKYETGKNDVFTRLVEKVSFQDPCDLNFLEAREKSRLRISVKGENEEADKIARELYSALSSKYVFSIDFHRFDRPT